MIIALVYRDRTVRYDNVQEYYLMGDESVKIRLDTEGIVYVHLRSVDRIEVDKSG